MQVDLSPFLRAGPALLEYEVVLDLPPQVVGGLGRAAEVRERAEVRVDLSGNRRLVRARIRAGLRLHCACDRCLAAVVVPVDVDYLEEWRLRPGVPPDPRAVEGDDDDEVVVRRVVSDPVVDLTDGLWQNVGFALPTKVLCRPDCRGLCPRCGADRNVEACGCAEADLDPRLAALAAWRRTIPQG